MDYWFFVKKNILFFVEFRSDMKKKRDLLKCLIDDLIDFGYRYCDVMEINKGM